MEEKLEMMLEKLPQPQGEGLWAGEQRGEFMTQQGSKPGSVPAGQERPDGRIKIPQPCLSEKLVKSGDTRLHGGGLLLRGWRGTHSLRVHKRCGRLLSWPVLCTEWGLGVERDRRLAGWTGGSCTVGGTISSSRRRKLSLDAPESPSPLRLYDPKL